ncbi:hypothetical protein Goarm_020379 [Gossypium armourianum]|uniref:ZF-HD dimerization-type domain-containing protein n=1 Tax=Gossypium armourianum TaxID=34283 RepID=A0A7J9INH9_9ROSI|nr:hypothetical protein [Gossypium armourianum]
MEKKIYRDCQRNQACCLGGYAIDGCTQFIPFNNSKTHCKACGCPRNYHRKVLCRDLEQSPNGKSFRSLREAKRMARQQQSCGGVNMKQRKSKFSMGQREAMREFGEGLGWSMRNKDRQEEINRFCERIGVSRIIFKTWLNNRKKCYFKGTSSANISS